MTTGSAQALDSEFVNGRDYTFERMEATGKVHDDKDSGTIRLEEAGGRGEYVIHREHALPNGHTVASNPLLWERQADSFLKSMDTPAAIQP